MPATHQEALIKKLKQQVKQLQRKEAQTKKDLKKALSQAKKVGKQYETKLTSELKSLRKGLSKTKADPYLRAVEDVEKRVKKKLLEKRDTMMMAVCELEDRFLSIFSDNDIKKSKPAKRKSPRKKRN